MCQAVKALARMPDIMQDCVSLHCCICVNYQNLMCWLMFTYGRIWTLIYKVISYMGFFLYSEIFLLLSNRAYIGNA